MVISSDSLLLNGIEIIHRALWKNPVAVRAISGLLSIMHPAIITSASSLSIYHATTDTTNKRPAKSMQQIDYKLQKKKKNSSICNNHRLKIHPMIEA